MMNKPVPIKPITKLYLILVSITLVVSSPSSFGQINHIENIHSLRPSVKRSAVLMTTNIEFEIVSDDSMGANKAIDNALEEMTRIETLMSEWQASSDISKVNRLAGKQAVPVGTELFMLFQEAIQIARLSDGKFDPTFKSAGKLWDFRTETIPSDAHISDAIKAINYTNVELEESTKSIFLKNAKTQVGLGGIAKGYAVDRAAQVIEQAGFDEFSINAGGDLFVKSRSAKSESEKIKRWRVGIQNPRNADELIAIVPVANAAVASSGDYERYFIKDGKRYHHIIDPDTGYPAKLCQSVTIIAPRAYLADALATAVFVLGPEKGMALVEKISNVEAIIIDQYSKVSVSSTLEKLN